MTDPQFAGEPETDLPEPQDGEDANQMGTDPDDESGGGYGNHATGDEREATRTSPE